jgi:hypothetical protein
MKCYAQYLYKSYSRQIRNEQFYFRPGVAFSMIGDLFSGRVHRWRCLIDSKGSSIYPEELEDLAHIVCTLNTTLSRETLNSLNPTISFQVGDVNRLPLFPIESAEEIFAQLEEAFTEHEAARETSVEFKQPAPSAWNYAQAWAQQAVDREPGAQLPDYRPVLPRADAPPPLAQPFQPRVGGPPEQRSCVDRFNVLRGKIAHERMRGSARDDKGLLSPSRNSTRRRGNPQT